MIDYILYSNGDEKILWQTRLEKEFLKKEQKTV
jgi:hypothetical protein